MKGDIKIAYIIALTISKDKVKTYLLASYLLLNLDGTRRLPGGLLTFPCLHFPKNKYLSVKCSPDRNTVIKLLHLHNLIPK